MRPPLRLTTLPLLLLLLVGCSGPSGGSATPTVPQPAATIPAAPLPTGSPVARAGTTTIACPVTPYSAGPPPGSEGDRAIAGLLAGKWYGGEGLWAFPWLAREPAGTLYLDPSSGGERKILWWRAPGVRGAVSVEGRQLDGPAPPVRLNLTSGFGETGQQPSAVHFPTAGCWQITARAGNASLTFVALVIEAPTAPATPTGPASPPARDQASTPAASPTTPLPAGCDEATIVGVVDDFVAAFNAGDQASQARLFPERGADADHPWSGDPNQLRSFTLVRASPGTGVEVLNLYTREALLAYFAERHARHERLRIVDLVVNRAASGPGIAAINSRIARAADDLPEISFPGKGGMGCAHSAIFRWSRGGAPLATGTPPNPPPPTTPGP